MRRVLVGRAGGSTGIRNAHHVLFSRTGHAYRWEDPGDMMKLSLRRRSPGVRRRASSSAAVTVFLLAGAVLTAGVVTGNLTGDVTAFVKYLSTPVK
jgi:hypothetical protein